MSTAEARKAGTAATATGPRLGGTGVVPLAVLTGLAAAQHFDLAAFGVLAPEIRDTFGLDTAGINAVSALTTAVPILFAVFMGNLGDRFDRVRISRWAGLLWGVTAVLTGLAPALAVLIIARLLGGIGLLSAQTIYPSLLSDVYPGNATARVFTTYFLGSAGLGLVGGPLAGWLGDRTGWRPTFVILAIPTFVFVALLHLIKDPRRHAGDGTASSGHGHQTVREGFRAVRSVPTLRRIWYFAFVIGGGVVPFTTLVSVFFDDVYHLGASARGAIGVASGATAMLGMVAGGWLAQRALDRRRRATLSTIMAAAALVVGLSAAAMALLPVLWGSVVAVSIAGLGVGGFVPVYTTTVSTVTPGPVRSQAFAWTIVFYAIGAVVVSSLIGALADAAGQRTAMTVLGFLVAGASGIVISTRSMIDRDSEVAASADAADSVAVEGAVA